MTKTIHRPMALLVLLAGVVLILGLASRPAQAATTFTVNKKGDAEDRTIDGVCDTSLTSGSQCTLRAAIQEANATPNSEGPDEINFAIGGTATVKTISPTRPLPLITEALTIDGYSQGSQTADTSDDAKPNDKGLGSNAVIKIELNGTNAGANAKGLRVTAPDSTFKGLAINRFAQSGILIRGSGATGNKVEGNFIGTNASGTEALPNGANGVRIDGAPSNTIGGTQPAQRNLLSGNGGDGVEISGSGATGNRVDGNFIGTDASGSQNLGNSLDGVYIVGAPQNTIGGSQGALSNTISGNGNNGVEISGSGATGNEVGFNVIGIGADGFAMGNGSDGVLLSSGAHDNVIGGLTDQLRRVWSSRIAYNGGDGVRVGSDSSTGNTISFNETFENSGLGIDLSGGSEDSFGVTANDVDPTGSTDDSDTGPNDLQNYPVIHSAVEDHNTSCTWATVSFTFNSTPNQTFMIEFFSTAFDPSGHGEGGYPLDRRTVSTDANGSGDASRLIYTGGASTITATATNTATGDTSEFSPEAQVQPSCF